MRYVPEFYVNIPGNWYEYNRENSLIKAIKSVVCEVEKDRLRKQGKGMHFQYRIRRVK